MDADGGGVIQLTRNGEHDEGPVFSPDGAQIAFTRGPDNADGDIWTMNADGSGERQLTRTPGRDESPDWQPVADPVAPATPADPATPPPSGTGSIGVSPVRASGVALRLAGQRPRLGTALRRGVRLRVTLPERAPARLTATRGGRRIGRAARTLPSGRTVVRLRFSRGAVRRLRRVRRARVRFALATPKGRAALTLTLRR